MHEVILLCLFSTTIYGLPAQYQKLSLAEWGSYNFRDHKGPGTYAFGYDLQDPITNNIQYREEERHSNGTVTGSYGYLEPDGHVRIINYIADERGFRVIQEAPLSTNVEHSTKPPTTTTSTTTTTTAKPPSKPDYEIVGEFYPTFEFDEDLNNLQPVEFPPKELIPAPVYEPPQERRPNYFDNYLYSSVSPIFRFFLGSAHQNNQISPVFVYEDPRGDSNGWLTFRLN